MIFADLPPNSSVAGINLSAAACAIERPTSVEPVNANLSKPLWTLKYWPVLEPLPVIMFKTPFGKIPSINFVNSKILNDVNTDGLITVVQPATISGANFHAAIRNGKFQGIICPTTPICSFNTILNLLPSKTVAVPSSTL